MSYCVNCGVELEESLKNCPLCNTPVINPNELEDKNVKPAFPKERGQVESVKRKDLAILLTIVEAATAITCGLLNLLVFNQSAWSVLVIGICLMLWVFSIPAIIYTKTPIYLSLFLDGCMIGIYLYFITFLTKSNVWFWQLGLPVVILTVCIVELFTLCVRKISHSFLMVFLYIFVGLAIFCTGLELLIDRFLAHSIGLTWSAVVLTVCVIISILLVTVLSKKRLRAAVRRRLHF